MKTKPNTPISFYMIIEICYAICCWILGPYMPIITMHMFVECARDISMTVFWSLWSHIYFYQKKKEKRKKKPYLPESFRSSRKLMLKVAPYRQTIVTTQNFGLQICQNKNKKKVKGLQLEKYWTSQLCPNPKLSKFLLLGCFD